MANPIMCSGWRVFKCGRATTTSNKQTQKIALLRTIMGYHHLYNLYFLCKYMYVFGHIQVRAQGRLIQRLRRLPLQLAPCNCADFDETSALHKGMHFLWLPATGSRHFELQLINEYIFPANLISYLRCSYSKLCTVYRRDAFGKHKFKQKTTLF